MKTTHNILYMDIILRANNFDDIYRLVKNKTKREKGNVFELITKYIFLIHPAYSINTKNIWLYKEIPQNIVNKFKLPDKDKGINLFLETKDSEYYAIQSKFRMNVTDNINWGSLATFAGQLFVNNIKNAIFVTNTYDITDEIHKCEKIQCIYGDFFKDLDKEFFDNIRNHINNNKIVYKNKQLYHHQKDAVDATIKYFNDQNNNRGYSNMACGTGKTITTYHIDIEMVNKFTLILVPSLYLLSQIFKEWSRESYGKNIKFMLIGSDANIEECERLLFYLPIMKK